MATVTVLITQLNDARVMRTLASLEEQTRLPDDVLVADGGSRPEVLEPMRAWARSHPRVRVEPHPGTIPETRNSALPRVQSDLLVFLDTDQAAPPGWLEALVAPLERNEADFAGGPTRPLAPPGNKVEAYINDYEAWFYPNVVAHDITMLPMGNSAWRRSVFDAIGSFDRDLVWWTEDYDINLRAVQAGFRGRLVPEAWVWHDQSHLRSLKKVLRRKFQYSVGATVVYLKNGVLLRKIPRAAGTVRFRHRYEWLNLLVKPPALLRGLWAWKRMQRRQRNRASTRRAG